MWRIFAGPAILCLLVSAQAQENVPLKPGAGMETVEANCGACHSLDYPRINAPFLKRQGWEAVVNKTINGLQRARSNPPTPRSFSTISRRTTAAAFDHAQRPAAFLPLADRSSPAICAGSEYTPLSPSPENQPSQDFPYLLGCPYLYASFSKSVLKTQH